MHLAGVSVLNVLCACAFLVLHVTLAQINPDQCTTPNNEIGNCILLPQCPAIVNILQQRPISQENVEYVRKSGCGFDGSDPKVCCPLQQPTVSSTTTSPTYPTNVDTSELLPSLSHCGVKNEPKIYGGEEADIGEFPWMALLEYQTRSGKGFYCGGVLINSRYILTAAHCLKGKDLPSTWKLISVRLGEHNTSSEIDCQQVGTEMECAPPPMDIPIETQIAHENYDPFDINQYHDIALLRLSRDVNRTTSVAPICLPSGKLRDDTFDEEKMQVAGWGKTENKSSSDVILKLQLEVRNNSNCQDRYKIVKVAISDGQLCAGGVKGQDSCRGDSGGPLMKEIAVGPRLNYYALGVVSFGPSPCAMQGWPGVYTRVTKYVPWIISKLRP